MEKTKITVKAIINAQVDRVWTCWTDPKHIVGWNHASDDWHTTRAENDVRAGGRFLSRMEAKDGSFGFDFTGQYSQVEENRKIVTLLDDNRIVEVVFESDGEKSVVTETFETEQENTTELQRTGWQAILDNFKKYVESSVKFEKLHYEILINRSSKEVFNQMLDHEKYKDWSSVFNPTSDFIGSWEKGSKIVFVGTDSNGNQGGMVSRIKENRNGAFLSIEHIGLVKNGKEILSGPEIDDWKGLLENYTFTNNDGKTLVEVEIDSNQEFKPYFAETWPKALIRLKEICEKH